MRCNRAILIAFLLLSVGTAFAQEEAEEAESGGLRSLGLGVGIGLTVGLAAVGAGLAIGHTGAAAIGAIAEKPEMATWGLIIVALAEGIALYGLVIGFMLIGKL
ncbi:MAG: ATP synthase subunit C [Candidatus Hydrothermarchaeaceae archaeon]